MFKMWLKDNLGSGTGLMKNALSKLLVVFLLCVVLTSSSTLKPRVDRSALPAPPLPSFGVYRYHGDDNPDVTIAWLKVKPCSGALCVDCHVRVGDYEATLQGLKLRRPISAEIGTLQEYHLKHCYLLAEWKMGFIGVMSIPANSRATLWTFFSSNKPHICVEPDSRDEDGEYTNAMAHLGEEGGAPRYTQALVLDKVYQRMDMSSGLARQQANDQTAVGDPRRKEAMQAQNLIMKEQSYARPPPEKTSDKPLDLSMKTPQHDGKDAGRALETQDRPELVDPQEGGSLPSASSGEKRKAENQLRDSRPLKKRILDSLKP